MAPTPVFERGVLSRRHFLHRAGASAILALELPSLLHATPAQDETPHPGGVARLRGWDPRGWDPMLSGSYRTHRPASFVYNRLFRYRAGPDVPIGKMILEPDLVARWEEPSATRYIFHLRQGVHFHDKPPVGGREMTAADVHYSIERFLTVKGGSNRWILRDIDTVKVLGKYTVQVDLKQPNVWLLDYMADAMLLPIIAREVVEQFGDLKKPQAVIGTGPWTLALYERKVKSVFVKNPYYFRPGLPYLDEVHFVIIDDDSTALAAYMTGQLDFGHGSASSIGLEDLEVFKVRHPDWHYEPHLTHSVAQIIMRCDKAPFNDQRVRQAVSLAINRPEMMAFRMGHSRLNTAVPAVLHDWHLPVDQLGEGARYYQYDPDAARHLLKEAGYPQGFTTPMLVYTGYSSSWADTIDLVSNYLRQVGIDVQLQNKEYGAYLRSQRERQYDGLGLIIRRPWQTPDGFVYPLYRPDNIGKVDDATMWELVQQQRREKDIRKRKAIFDEISRQAAVNQYYTHFPASVRVATWSSYVRHYNTNLGHDYGGRLEAAWFARS